MSPRAADIAAASEDDWVPFQLTYIEYERGDDVGKLLAASGLLPVLTSVAFATWFVAKRDCHTFTYGVGIILNYAFNILLKNSIGEARPSSGRGEERLWQEYGMPSTHAQYMFFVSVYMVWFVTLRLHFQRTALETAWKVSWLCACIGCSVVVAYGRVYLKYHTPAQVLVGAAVGSGAATLWFGLTHRFFAPLFPVVCSWPVAEIVLLRDYSSIPNVFFFDYYHARCQANVSARRASRKSLNAHAD